jgi:inosose dehydratase
MSSENKSSTPMLIGIQPTCWTNDDFSEIGDDTPYQQILDDTAAAGYQGGSTGHNYPSHRPSLIVELQRRSLGITSTWVGTRFTAPGEYDATLDEVRRQIAYLKAVGASDIVVAELAGAVNQVRTKSVLTDRPIFNEAQWFLLTRGLNEAGRLARDAGLRLSFHPHVGSGVQSAAEASRLMDATEPGSVWLCVDSGHLYYAGDDPLPLTKKYLSRVGHVHLKSVREDVRARAVAGNYSFYQAVLEGIWTVPGDPDGEVDTTSIVKLLVQEGYTGWLVVEAEQDPAKAPPLQYAKMAREYLRGLLGY